MMTQFNMDYLRNISDRMVIARKKNEIAMLNGTLLSLEEMHSALSERLKVLNSFLYIPFARERSRVRFKIAFIETEIHNLDKRLAMENIALLGMIAGVYSSR